MALTWIKKGNLKGPKGDKGDTGSTIGLPVFAVNAIGDTTSLDGDTIVKPCILILPNTTPPAIYYSTK
jgi:hypothetical protein